MEVETDKGAGRPPTRALWCPKHNRVAVGYIGTWKCVLRGCKLEQLIETWYYDQERSGFESIANFNRQLIDALGKESKSAPSSD